VLRNPLITAIAGLVLGFFVGFLVGQGQPAAAVPQAAADPHAGVPGAPPLSGAQNPPPEGGRTATTASPQLMEQARELDRLLAKDPNNYAHLVQMGNVNYDMQNYPKAADLYEKARAIKDESADVMTDLGVCYREMKKPQSYREMKKPQKAIELFDKAADLAPEHWQSRYNAIVVRIFDVSDLAGAQQELETLKRLRSERPQLGIPDLAGLEQEIAKRRP
jgi:tetratricopeptide (TPR) repeat protein